MNCTMTNTTCAEMLKKGYIRVGRYTPKKPQKWELSYLLSGVIDDVESGRATITGKNPDGSIKAIYVDDKKKAPVSVWNRRTYNAENEGTNLLKNDFADEKRFPYPKSLYAVRDCLKYYLDDKPNAYIIIPDKLLPLLIRNYFCIGGLEKWKKLYVTDADASLQIIRKQ